MRVILKRPRAADDLIELWDYIAEDSVTRADAFIDDTTPSSISWPSNPCSAAAGDMTMATRAKPVRAAKRDLFAEVSEGMVALVERREGKRTLRTHGIDSKPPLKVNGAAREAES